MLTLECQIRWTCILTCYFIKPNNTGNLYRTSWTLSVCECWESTRCSCVWRIIAREDWCDLWESSSFKEHFTENEEKPHVLLPGLTFRPLIQFKMQLLRNLIKTDSVKPKDNYDRAWGRKGCSEGRPGNFPVQSHPILFKSNMAAGLTSSIPIRDLSLSSHHESDVMAHLEFNMFSLATHVPSAMKLLEATVCVAALP